MPSGVYKRKKRKFPKLVVREPEQLYRVTLKVGDSFFKSDRMDLETLKKTENNLRAAKVVYLVVPIL